MSRLYEDEDINIYDPKYGGTSKEHVQDKSASAEWAEAALERGRAAEELLNSAGWKLLEQRIESEVKILSAVLLDSTEPAVIARLQAAIKIYGNFEGFINRYVREGQLALQENELAQDNPQD